MDVGSPPATLNQILQTKMKICLYPKKHQTLQPLASELPSNFLNYSLVPKQVEIMESHPGPAVNR